MNAERKIARELAGKMADDRAHRIATMAAEELIRTEGEPTGDADKFLIPQCQADDHMRECIAHLVWHGEAMSEETEDGYVMVLFIDATVGAGFDGCGDPEQTLTAIAELKALQKIDAPQLRKIHPLDFPIEVFLADLTTRPANIIRAELAGFASYADTGTFDIEPPFTVRHLCMFSRREMRKWPNFGRKCLNEVEEMLRARGLQLWENHDERSLRLLREHKEYFK